MNWLKHSFLMFNKYLFIAVLAWLLSATVQANQSILRFEKYSLEEGLSQEAVFSIIQDRRGYIWFATQEGLNRFDGYEFKTYYHEPDNKNSLSHNVIVAILEDEYGHIWIGTDGGGLNKLDPTTETFTQYSADKYDLGSDRINTLFKDNIGNLWIGTEGAGLSKFDTQNDSFSNFSNQSENHDKEPNNYVRAITQDSVGNIVVGTDAGIQFFSVEEESKISPYHWQIPDALMDTSVRTLMMDNKDRIWVGTNNKGLYILADNTTEHYLSSASDIYSLCSNRVKDILLNSKQQIWLATDNGLCLWEENKRRFIQYQHQSEDLHSLSDNRTLSLYEDRGGVMWLGTFAGINKWRNTNIFHFRHVANDNNSLSNNVVTAFAQDRESNIWVGTYDGLNKYDKQTQRFVRYAGNSLEGRPVLKDNRIMSLEVDHAGDVWIGTRSQGVTRFNPKTETSIQYRHEPNNIKSISGNGVTSIFEDNQNRIWVGIYGGGLNLYERITGHFTQLRHDPDNQNSISTDRILSIYQSHDQLLWLGTEGGGINSIDVVSGDIKRYQHDPGMSGSLSNDVAWSIIEDNQKNLWIGTWGGGLNKWSFRDRKQGIVNFEHFGKSDGLPSSVIYDIQIDDAGFLWLSTNRGLTKFDPVLEKMQHFDISHGLQDYEFNKGAAFKDLRGNLYFGGSNGFNRFLPQDIVLNNHAPEVELTKILLMNKEIVIPSAFNTAPTIKLKYTDYLVALELAALDFSSPSKNKYQYRLSGLHEDWIDVGTTRRITLTNLPAGDFDLQVKASNNDGVWSEIKSPLRLAVDPPPWKTWWAYSIYFGLVFAVIAFYLRSHKEKLREKAEYSRALEHKVRQRTQQLTDANKQLAVAKAQAEAGNRSKGAFIANISHEFRTPMTSIIGFTESLVESDVPKKEKERRLGKVLSNAKHMLHLINKILDLSKLEANKLDIELAPCSPGLLLMEVEALISQQAELKGLDFEVDIEFPIPESTQCDAVRLKQILLNLCSNSIKFTNKGQVVVKLSADIQAGVLLFSIKDSGIGIEQEKLKSIFDSFSQADTSTTRKYGGTGLGLSISRELVRLLGGEIHVSSELGKGSQFSFSIPILQKATTRWLNSGIELQQVREVHTERPCEVPRLTGKVLLAEDWEDNRDLIQMLVAATGADITVVENGRRVVESALSDDFDLILMDIQMPELDGESATRMLRGAGFSKPIVALTANVSVKETKGYISAGFDTCLAKPIDRMAFYQVLSCHLFKGSIKSTVDINSLPEQKLVSNFLRRLPGLLNTISHNMLSENWSMAFKLLHNLKGVGGSFGFPKLTEHAEHIQQLLRRQNNTEALRELNKIIKNRSDFIRTNFMSTNKQTSIH